MAVKVNALDHIVINVTDVARSAQWYQKILGMEIRVFDPGPGKTPRTSLIFGNQKINVRPRDADKVEWFTADHETAGSDDLCFLTASTPEQVVAHLTACGVAIAEGDRQGEVRHYGVIASDLEPLDKVVRALRAPDRRLRP